MLKDYIGIPFKLLGRTEKGCDCYGLVRLILMKEYGITLPLFDDGYSNIDDRQLASLVDAGLGTIKATKVDKPKEGDLVILRYLGEAKHIALYIGYGAIIHTEEYKNAHIESLSSPFIARRVVGYYRVN